MAVQTITQGTAQSTVPVYYVPPPQGFNIMASFWHGFHQTRSPWATQLFLHNLKQMDPQAKLKAIQDQIQSVSDEMARRSEARSKAQDQNLKAWEIQTRLVDRQMQSETTIKAASIKARADVEVGAMANETKRMEQQEVPEQQREKVADLKSQYQAAIDAGNVREASAKMIQMMRILGSDPTPRMAETGEWIRMARGAGLPQEVLTGFSELAAEYGSDPRLLQTTEVEVPPAGGTYTGPTVRKEFIDNLMGGLDSAIQRGVPEQGRTSSSTRVESRVPTEGGAAPTASPVGDGAAPRTPTPSPATRGPEAAGGDDMDAFLEQQYRSLVEQYNSELAGYKPPDHYAALGTRKPKLQQLMERQDRNLEAQRPEYDPELEVLVGDNDRYLKTLDRTIDADLALKGSAKAGGTRGTKRRMRNEVGVERNQRLRARAARRSPGKVQAGEAEVDDGIDELLEDNSKVMGKKAVRASAKEMVDNPDAAGVTGTNQDDIEDLMEDGALDPLLSGDLEETEEERKARLAAEARAARGTVR